MNRIEDMTAQELLDLVLGIPLVAALVNHHSQAVIVRAAQLRIESRTTTDEDVANSRAIEDAAARCIADWIAGKFGDDKSSSIDKIIAQLLTGKWRRS